MEPVTLPAIDEELEKTIEADGGKRLTPAEWAEIKELWELGTATGEEICERFAIKPDNLKKRLLRHGVKKGSRAAEVAAAAGAGVKAAVKAASAPAEPSKTAEQVAAERKGEINSTKRQHIGWVNTLEKAAMGRLAAAQKDGRPFSTEDGNLKAIERVMKIIVMGREELYNLLDAHGEVDDKELPELTIKNLTDQQIQKLREKQEEDDGDLVEEESSIAVEEDDIVVEENDDGTA